MRALAAPMLSHLDPQLLDIMDDLMEIGAGLGPLAGKIWRVGLMGSSSTQALLTLFLAALGSALKEQRVEVSHK